LLEKWRYTAGPVIPTVTTRPPDAATPRDRAKAERHGALLREATRLFAAHGFDGVSLEDPR
jgi:AcrR family transcriptional regulator